MYNSEICAVCGGVYGLHNHMNKACPKDINADRNHTEYRRTVFSSTPQPVTREGKTPIEFLRCGPPPNEVIPENKELIDVLTGFKNKKVEGEVTAKTAMQELILKLDREIENNYIRDSPVTTAIQQSPFKVIKNFATELLAKEREQIEKAVTDTIENTEYQKDGDGYIHCPFDGSDYFTNTYKQS